MVAVSQNGGLLRLDYDLYVYQFKSKALTAVTKSLLAVTVVLSTAVLKGLNVNDIRGIVSDRFPIQ
jgi:hypothetical protein